MNLSLVILYVHVSVLLLAIDTTRLTCSRTNWEGGIEDVLALNWFEDFVSTFITVSPQSIHHRYCITTCKGVYFRRKCHNEYRPGYYIYRVQMCTFVCLLLLWHYQCEPRIRLHIFVLVYISTSVSGELMIRVNTPISIWFRKTLSEETACNIIILLFDSSCQLNRSCAFTMPLCVILRTSPFTPPTRQGILLVCVCELFTSSCEALA